MLRSGGVKAIPDMNLISERDSKRGHAQCLTRSMLDTPAPVRCGLKTFAEMETVVAQNAPLRLLKLYSF